MTAKKTKINCGEMASVTKQWKETGPEQKELDRLFDNKSIDDSTTPNKVRLSHPMFSAFSAKVFAAHFRKSKAKHGLYANNNDTQEEKSFGIPELGFPNTSNNSQPACSYKADADIGGKGDPDMELNNTPFTTWVYTDFEKQCDLFCVAVAVNSGSQDIHFGLSEDGMKLFITYTWPAPLYSPTELFKKKINNNMSLDHPKIHGYALRLLECEFSEKSKPKGNMVISLPVKVQRDVGTWSKEGIKCNDTNIVLLEFKAYQKKLIIEDADTSITFS